jgi:hypothetical protein
LSRLINDKHHHIVTTLPKELRWMAQNNYNLLYNILFKVISNITPIFTCSYSQVVKT